MADDLYARWQQTHDLEAVFGGTPGRLPEALRQQLPGVLARLPAAQAVALLSQVHDALAGTAGWDQALQTFHQARASAMPQTGVLGTVDAASGASAPPTQQVAAGDLSPSFPTQQQAPSAQPITPPPADLRPDPSAAVLDTLASYLGISTAQLARQYQQYTQLVQGQRQRFAPTLRGEQGAAAQVMPLNEWAQSQMQALEGSYTALLNAYDAYYQQAYGQPMPPDLRAQLRQAILAAPAQAQGQMIQALTPATGAAGTQGTAGGQWYATLSKLPGSGTFSFLDQLIANYAKVHPTAQSEADAQTKAYIDNFYQTFGRMPSATDVARFGTMSQQDFTDFVNNQPFRNGLTYKNYKDTQKRFNSQWVSAFGKDLTDAQIANLAGMSDQDFTDWLDQQPSRVHGMNYGEFSSMQGALSKETTAEFGHEAPDELVKYFHEALSA
jgi:hypothetical protein